jgi:hypothetical protein
LPVANIQLRRASSGPRREVTAELSPPVVLRADGSVEQLPSPADDPWAPERETAT